MTSKKHFESAAVYVKVDCRGVKAKMNAYRFFVRWFKEDNPRFDEARFREACGLREST